MNAERLHAIVIALKDELEERNTVKYVSTMVEALRSVVQQSNQANQQSLSSSLKNMYAALANTPSDKFSPAWRQILSEIGASELFGKTLKERIESILAANQITPAVALQELEQLSKTLQEFDSGLDEAGSAFRLFRIGDERLAPGDCEVGILIPREAIKNQLLDFANELKELGFILNTFSEVVTGKPDELTIRTVSSSDLLVHLQAAAPYAACVAVAIERVVSLYKQLLEIRKILQDLRTQGVPVDSTRGLEGHANELMEKGIERISVEIIDEFHQGKDKGGRKHELTNAVRISLNKIANRIDHGFNLEVRVEPTAQGEKAGGSEETQKAVELIQAASANMQFLKLEGQPLLKLPEVEDKTKKKES